MKLINYEIPCNHNYKLPPLWWREMNAEKATAINAKRFPILARHFPGLVLIGDRLAYDETNQQACQRAAQVNGRRK